MKRRSEHKMSSCGNCSIQFRPGIKGRYKFCSEVCRFLNKILKDKDTGCWLWQAGIHKDGYGDFVPLGGKSGLAHRASYRLFKGPIDDGMLILHSCHTPRCVFPDHLRQGTNSDNVRDKTEAKRNGVPFGDNHHNSKISSCNVAEIKKLSEEGNSYAIISKKYGITPCQVSNIVRGISWKHV